MSPDAAATPPTRVKLMDAAVGLIGEVGWQGVTTRLVAERAGVNPALVHYHFGSVEGLLAEAATAALLDAGEAPTVALLESPDVAAGISAAVRGIAELASAGPMAAASLELTMRATRDELLRDRLSRALAAARGAVAGRLAAGVASGELPAYVDPQATAVWLTALLDGLALHALLDHSLDLDAVAEALAGLLKGER